MSKLTESQRIDLLRFELESIEAGGPEMVDTDTYEVTGDADASWELSLSAKCGEALAEIRRLERESAMRWRNVLTRLGKCLISAKSKTITEENLCEWLSMSLAG